MNNFNVVLEIIKLNCAAPGIPCTTCLSHIMQELDSTCHEHIDFYLSFLHDLGLIQYDLHRQEITLTETGKCTTSLFA